MNEALGMIEVKGLVVATEVADIMVKTASVRLNELKITKGIGWVTVVVLGDVGAVQAAIEAAKITALSKNAFITAKVIPRPVEGIIETILIKKSNKLTSAEEIAPQINTKYPKKIETQDIQLVSPKNSKKDHEKLETTETQKTKQKSKLIQNQAQK